MMTDEAQDQAEKFEGLELTIEEKAEQHDMAMMLFNGFLSKLSENIEKLKGHKLPENLVSQAILLIGVLEHTFEAVEKRQKQLMRANAQVELMTQVIKNVPDADEIYRHSMYCEFLSKSKEDSNNVHTVNFMMRGSAFASMRFEEGWQLRLPLVDQTFNDPIDASESLDRFLEHQTEFDEDEDDFKWVIKNIKLILSFYKLAHMSGTCNETELKSMINDLLEGYGGFKRTTFEDD